MKNKIITGFGSVIALLYTVLIVLAVDGLGRAGIINSIMDLLGFENGSIYGVLLFTVCLVILVFYYIVITKRKSNAIAMMLIASFIIGAILLGLITKVTSVRNDLFSLYISWFYHGVYYEGEEKVQQVFSYISRLVVLCFCCGGIISAIFMKLIKRNLIKV
ncbi:MAG TPA: hypothetical protein VGI71_09400 [Scandinavium sp.]|jgi:hypothetical protein